MFFSNPLREYFQPTAVILPANCGDAFQLSADIVPLNCGQISIPLRHFSNQLRHLLQNLAKMRISSGVESQPTLTMSFSAGATLKMPHK